MSTFEKVGGFLLFERIEEDRLSKDMLAGQINGSQVQQVCVIKRFDSSLATLPDFITDLNQEYEVMKALSNPNIIKPLQFVQDKKEFAAVFDYVEGKTLRTVLKKCSQDGYPFTVDHALLVASRLCTALEYLHSKKLNEQRLIHGYVSPEAILITYDGEIRLQYLGLAHALLKFPAGKEKLFHDYKNYLAPELLNQQKWDKTIDIYGAGLVLYEMLTGEPLDRTQTLEDLINEAMMNSNSGEKMPLPDDLKKLLYQALAIDPANRFHSVSDMRKALDLSLFSSEFSPTTFNLAFFMHSLFRDSIDEETKKIGLYKKTDFSAHLKPEPPVLAAPAPATTSASQPVKKQDPVGAIVDELHPTAQAPTRVIEHKPQPHHTAPANKEFFETPEEKEKSKLPIFAGLLLIVAVGAAIFYFFALKPAKTPTAKPVPQQPAIQGLTPEQLKLQAEERKKLEMDALKAQEEARKKDEELKTLQAKLDALLKAQQDEAKKKKQDEKASQIDPAAIKKLQQEAKRLEEEKKQQQALAEQKLKEAQAPPVVEQAQPESVASATDIVSSPGDGGSQVGQPELQTPTEAQPEPELIQPSVIEGQVVDLTPDVVKPEILSRVNPTYPPIAQQKKVEGTVIIGVLISERGDVAEAKVLRSAGGYGLNEAALTAVRKWRFRPAVKEGKRVKVWMTYPIVFKLGKV